MVIEMMQAKFLLNSARAEDRLWDLDESNDHSSSCY